jgi:MFS family permease
MSIPYFMASFLMPFFGGLLDNYGHRASLLTFVPIVLFLIHFLLAVTDVDPVYLMIAQGFSYCAFASSLWPSFASSVESKYCGFCFGVATCFQNIGLAIAPLLVAWVYLIADHRYIPLVEFLFCGFALGSFIIMVLVYIFENNTYKRLNMPINLS